MRATNSIVFILILFVLEKCNCENKYSADANMRSVDPPVDMLRTLDKPYRMAKLNMLWAKAQVRLTEPKLKSLFGELKLHDKEEITWKRLKAEGKDKDGMQEATLRKKLIGIMSSYDLLEHFSDVHDVKKHKQHQAFNDASDNNYVNKNLFKDKKLNKLWSKAELAGFTPEELIALREEFNHHQDKIDQYYAVLDDVDRGKQDDHENSVDEDLDRFNTLVADEEVPNKNYLDRTNLLREKHRGLRDGYDRLHRLAAKGPNSKEFVEPRVQTLWRSAVDSNFTHDELESLRVELKHYERRLQKLRAMQVEAALDSEKLENKQKILGQKPDALSMMEENIKKQANKLNKLHDHFAERINTKHLEL